MCLFSKEIRSPCSSFTSFGLHRNLDDFVTSRSRVVCQEALKMIFISSNIELQIYGLKLVPLRTYECTGSTQSVGELTGSVRLSPVATIPRLIVATAPPLTVDAELTRFGRLSSTAYPSPPIETTSPPWVYRLPYLERVTVSRVLVPPSHCVFASLNRKEAPRIQLARELDCSDGIKPPTPDAQRPSPNADSRSIMFFKFVVSSALSLSSIIFRVTVKVKAIPVSDLSTGLRFSLGFSESYGYRYGLLSWQWWSSSQLSDFTKHGFVVSVFVAVSFACVYRDGLNWNMTNDAVWQVGHKKQIGLWSDTSRVVLDSKLVTQ
ncbi:hypothetical protein Bca101_089310 [Brassica carinata]